MLGKTVDNMPHHWQPGSAPVAVIMISLNEAHNMEAVLENLKGWAQEVFLVDSYSKDETVDIALRHGVHVVQRRFRGFGDQWNFAVKKLPITTPWTMKLDPDERLTDELKLSIINKIVEGSATGISFDRRLWFMGTPLPIKQEILRVWKTGSCKFSEVIINEHPFVDGAVKRVEGILEHHDSPNLHHWVEKQNWHTTGEAIARYRNDPLAAQPLLFGSPFERRMWLKKNYTRFPLRHWVTFLVRLSQARPWVTGYSGFAWARLRVWVGRMIEDKIHEMRTTGHELSMPVSSLGQPHPQAHQDES